jgi:hypothetical protein
MILDDAKLEYYLERKFYPRERSKEPTFIGQFLPLKIIIPTCYWGPFLIPYEGFLSDSVNLVIY